MRRESTAALVLRRWPYSEHSLALRLLTPGHGVLSVLAKGAYKPTSGFFGVLDTWALVEVQLGFHEEAEMQNLFAARLLDRMSGLSADPDRLAVAGFAAELAELAAPPGAEAATAFHYLLSQLHELTEGDAPGRRLLLAAAAGLELLGLSPELEAAADPGGEAAWLCVAEGRLLAQGEARPHGPAHRVGGPLLALLRALRAGEAAAVDAARSEDREAALTILGDLLHYHPDRPPRAWDFLRRRRPTAATR